MEEPEQQLWTDFRRGDLGARDLLIQKYLPFAKGLTKMLYAKRPPGNAEFADFLHLAYVGLLEAMQRYQFETPAAFSTFAAYRIRGAILNGIPKMSERGEYVSYLRRAQRERTKSLLDSYSESSLDFSKAVDLIVSIALTHQLEELVADVDSASGEDSDPYSSHAYDELQNKMRMAISQLSERDQQIISYHYYSHASFEEISEMLGVSKGRVSQLHKRILSELRTQLQDGEMVRIY